jgi:hypothetical protein
VVNASPQRHGSALRDRRGEPSLPTLAEFFGHGVVISALLLAATHLAASKPRLSFPARREDSLNANAWEMAQYLCVRHINYSAHLYIRQQVQMMTDCT